MTADPNSLIGYRIFGGYTISRKIGEGGMGAVYIAENLDLNKKLAVKILLPEWSTNKQIVARFLAEARAASAINHPNIIEILDAAQLPDGSHYMLMEYLDGTPLDNFADRWGAMALDMTLAIIAQVCSALDAAHTRGIIHRDLKPANLFVSPRLTNQLFTKVLDFGIAKLNDARLAGSIKTGTNAVAGTPAYMSPEQARATRDVDHRADIYSLGVIIYEMLAGTRPYPANSIGELAYQQATSQPRPLAEHRPDLPPQWCQIVASCLATDPNQRPKGTRDLAHALVAATPNGQNIATAVAPLLFTNAPRSAETFRYQGNYGIGVAPSEPHQGAAANQDMDSAHTMAGDVAPAAAANHSVPASAPVAHTLSAAPAGRGATATAEPYARGATATAEPYARGATATAEPYARGATATAEPYARGATATAEPHAAAPPITTLSSVASQASSSTPTSKRPAWAIPAVVVAALGVAAITFVLVKSTRGGSSNGEQAAATTPPPDAAPPPPDARAGIAKVTPDAAAPTAPPATKKLAPGTVVLVNRYRGARVLVDKKRVGLTGRTTRLKLPPGTHHIRVEAHRHVARTYDVEVASAKVAAVTFHLRRRHATSRPSHRPPVKPPHSVKKPPTTTKKPPQTAKKPPQTQKPKGNEKDKPDFDGDAPGGASIRTPPAAAKQ